MSKAEKEEIVKDKEFSKTERKKIIAKPIAEKPKSGKGIKRIFRRKAVG